jgi:hypothetical protein
VPLKRNALRFALLFQQLPDFFLCVEAFQVGADLRRMGGKVGPRPKSLAWAVLRRPPGGFHALHLGQLPAFAPALALRGSDHAGDSDIGVHGLMNEAPGSGLVRWQGSQIGEVMAALFLMRQVVEHVTASNRAG